MPVHLEERSGKHCVVEPGGDVVPSGCHDAKPEALAHLQAINSEKDSVNYLQTLGDVPTHSPEGMIVTTSDVSTGNTHKWYGVGDNGLLEWREPMEDEVKEVDGDMEEKFGGALGLPPVSLSELDTIREEQKQDMGLKKLLSDFMAVVGNIMSFPSEKGKAEDLKSLIKEFEERLPEEDEEEGAEEKDSSVESKTDNLFMIWKDAETGEYRWLGVYSNKFRDDDSPSEILAEKAHLHFIEQVEKGQLAYPDLYVWHIPVPVGKADLLAFDDAGFSIAAGVVKEEFAIALSNTSHDLAMSHGMPAKSIRRDAADNSVIVEYVTTEVSVLPRFAAANKMTGFYILNDEEEAKMAIIPEKKRQQVAELLGSDLTEQLETDLASRSSKALAEGVEFKEENQQVEEDDQETEAAEEKTEEIVAEVEEVVEEPVAGAEGEAEESVDPDAGEVEEFDEDESAEVEEKSDKEELAGTLATIVATLTAQNKQIMEAVMALGSRVDAVEGAADEVQKSDEERIAQLAASTPAASLDAMLAKKLGAKSVIGNPVTRVHGNNALAKEAPEEAELEEAAEGKAGLFFSKWQ